MHGPVYTAGSQLSFAALHRRQGLGQVLAVQVTCRALTRNSRAERSAPAGTLSRDIKLLQASACRLHSTRHTLQTPLAQWPAVPSNRVQEPVPLGSLQNIRLDSSERMASSLQWGRVQLAVLGVVLNTCQVWGTAFARVAPPPSFTSQLYNRSTPAPTLPTSTVQT